MSDDSPRDIAISAIAMLLLGAMLLVFGGWCATGIGAMVKDGFILRSGLLFLGIGTIIGIGGGAWLIFHGVKALVKMSFQKNDD